MILQRVPHELLDQFDLIDIHAGHIREEGHITGILVDTTIVEFKRFISMEELEGFFGGINVNGETLQQVIETAPEEGEKNIDGVGFGDTYIAGGSAEDFCQAWFELVEELGCPDRLYKCIVRQDDDDFVWLAGPEKLVDERLKEAKKKQIKLVKKRIEALENCI